MAQTITQLTPGQEKRLAAVYEEWLAVGRSCEPINRNAAKAILGEFYEKIGKPAPRVLFFSSPVMCVLAHGALGALGEANQLWDQLWDQLWGQLGDQLRDQLWGQLGGQLWDQLWGQLGGQLGGQVISNHCAGQHWCAWEVFYAFCGEIGARYTLAQSAIIDLWLRQSRGLHWWFPYEGIVLASERHTSVHVDDRGRLHHPTELACGYSDGWGVHAWHGTRIPSEYYAGEITASAILGERNAEVRRALIERHGQDRFMLEAGAKVIDTAPQKGSRERNELIALDLPEDPDGRMVALKLRCPSTNACYIIRVPPDVKSVQQGLAWSYGFEKPAQYAPLVET